MAQFNPRMPRNPYINLAVDNCHGRHQGNGENGSIPAARPETFCQKDNFKAVQGTLGSKSN
jgi:hypothetical protein